MRPFRRVAMLGIGLINGSLAAVLRHHGAAGEIVAFARGEHTRARALELGLCDRAEADPAAAVAGADLVVLGVPPAAVGEVAAAMRPGLPADALVTDVSSIKAQIVRDVVPHLPTPSLFVPGHPVAGTEHSGPDAAFATLFVRRRCILTPIEDTDPLTGFPDALADQMKRPRRRTWEGIMAEAPLRSLLFHVRPKPAVLDALAAGGA